jgi:hypothetical protein
MNGRPPIRGSSVRLASGHVRVRVPTKRSTPEMGLARVARCSRRMVVAEGGKYFVEAA